jgi:hypothetical protein
MCIGFRVALRLNPAADPIESTALIPKTKTLFIGRHTVAVAVHRYEESIAGRAYLIEVMPIAVDRWRAYIVRVPGVPTALMPFYGRTPDEAALLLSNWLSRAHGTPPRVAPPV